MAKVSTLFKKGYLLTGMIMAANMFVVNEMKAMNSPYDKKDGLMATEEKEQNFGKEEKKKKKNNNNKKNFFTQDSTKDTTMNILFWENYFNSFFTLALSGFNNYFKWWDYNAGGYCNLRIGYLGWRTKKFFDIVQLDFNLNLGRGALWLIPGYLFFFIQGGCSRYKYETACSFVISLQFSPTRYDDTSEIRIKKHFRRKVIAFSLFILQGFISAPLTFHIFNFSISISLDSIFWELVAMVAIWARKKVDKIQPGEENILFERK